MTAERRVLLIEDNPLDADLTIENLGPGVNVDWVDSLSKAFQRLELGHKYERIIFDLGLAGSDAQKQEDARQKLQRFGFTVLCYSGDDRPEVAERVRRGGGTFRSKSEVLKNNDTLMEALGWSALASERERAKDRSTAVRRIEQVQVQHSYQIQENTRQIIINNDAIAELKSQIAGLKKDLNDEITDRKDLGVRVGGTENAIGKMELNAARKVAHVSGFWQVFGLVVVAIIGAVVQIAISFYTKK